MPRYKRPYDLIVLALVYLAFLPVWVLLWTMIPLAILLTDRGPVFYRQERLGRNGRVFRIIKFRTMVQNAEAQLGPVWADANDPRTTRLGRILRETRLDEIPQALNILRGEMSIVGPRPERPELARKFEQRIPGFGERLRVLPGIAGLAHVRGDSHTPPRHRLRYDNLYIERMNPWLDTQLILLSLWVVAQRYGGQGAPAKRIPNPSPSASLAESKATTTPLDPGGESPTRQSQTPATTDSPAAPVAPTEATRAENQPPAALRAAVRPPAAPRAAVPPPGQEQPADGAAGPWDCATASPISSGRNRNTA